MKKYAYPVLNWLQHRKVSKLGKLAQMPASTRLFRSFSIKFLANPEDRSYFRIGTDGFLNCHVVFEARSGSVDIGDRCYIGVGSTIICRDEVTIGDDVTIAWDVMIYDHDSHSLDWQDRSDAVRHFYDHYGEPGCFDTIDWKNVRSAPINIERRVWIGFGTVVLKGVTIGEGAVVAARSVVTRNVEPYTVVAGNPAREVRRLQRPANDPLE